MLSKAILIGYLGGDPEQTEFKNGGSIVTFNLATSERWKTKDGEKKEKTHWLRIVVMQEQLQKVAMDYLEKGSKVYVEGIIAVNKWADKDTGEEKSRVEIQVKGFSGKIVMLDSKGRSDDSPPDESYEQE